MQVLPDIVLGQGFQVTLRQRVSGPSKAMLTGILRVTSFERPDQLEHTDQVVGTVYNKPIYSMQTKKIFYKTKTMQSPVLGGDGQTVNPPYTIFVSFADPKHYAQIDTMLAKFVKAQKLELLSTALVP